MISVLYLIVMVTVGDLICRRFFKFVSLPHRLAAGFLVGLFLSSWVTYCAALIFAGTSKPLLWGNILFFLIAVSIIVWLTRWRPSSTTRINLSSIKSEKWDWIFSSLYLVFSSWLMLSTLSWNNGSLRVGGSQWSDFGPNLAIIQSFALGHNFPTEYPHFAGDRIRYHFLYYFQIGNFEYLGLNPAWSNNLLSILTLTAMLIMVMALGEILFNSRVVGRLGSVLFLFVNSSLSYIPYLRAKPSVTEAITSIFTMPAFLQSGFPYRGEGWGIFTMNTYANQRHLASSIGILLLVLCFLIDRYREKLRAGHEGLSPASYEPDQLANAGGNGGGSALSFYEKPEERSSDNNCERSVSDVHATDPTVITLESTKPPVSATPFGTNMTAAAVAAVRTPPAEQESASAADEDDDLERSLSLQVDRKDHSPGADFGESETLEPWYSMTQMKGYIFSGILLGTLPFWNSAIFGAAFVVLTVLFALFPLRRQMLILAGVTATLAIPQIAYLRSGMVKSTYSLFHWGYIVENPTLGKVLNYLGYTFGLKWLVILFALALVSWFHWRVFLAISSLLVMTFVTQSSVEVIANHKFLHVWLIIINLFVAHGLWRVYRIRIFGSTIIGKIAAIALAVGMTVGGAMDLFPIHNAYWIETPYQDDPILEWVRDATDKKAVFLTDRYVQHPILLAGRRIFFGWPYFTWGLGYPTGQREALYRKMFEERRPGELWRLLHENSIDYVVVDDGIRRSDLVKNPNESVYRAYFPKVFEYGSTIIFKVPETEQLIRNAESHLSPEVALTLRGNMFTGGTGTGSGQFSAPKGIAVDQAGNVLVADANNNRLQKFSSNGDYLAEIGSSGPGDGELSDPNGIAIDPSGLIYVVDAANQRIQKFNATGSYVANWRPPSPGFYWPRDIAIGPDKDVYVVDQGRDRIVVFTANGDYVGEWGHKGSGNGEFNEPSAVVVDTDRVYVADHRNGRVQVFDTKGTFLNQWTVEEWQQAFQQYPDLALDKKAARLYASNPTMNQVLVFDLSGKRLGTLEARLPDKLEAPTALALYQDKRLYVINSTGVRVSVIELTKSGK